MAKLLEKDNIREKVAHNTDNGEIVIATEQDVTNIIEQNKKEYNQTNGRWGEDVFDNKIASIPLTVIDDLNKLGIMRGFHVVDQKKFRAWLNNPDNRFFRTRQGRV
ncbi:hypothetical protein MTPG_00005 [Methylophilales phage HIM624-A]|nr:hypothetical protein MTPG_00005 [Methylophilales phage HIM624-A]